MPKQVKRLSEIVLFDSLFYIDNNTIFRSISQRKIDISKELFVIETTSAKKYTF